MLTFICRYDLAVKLFTDAVEMKKVTLSEDSLEVAKTLNNLGQTLVVLKKPEQALKLYHDRQREENDGEG